MRVCACLCTALLPGVLVSAFWIVNWRLFWGTYIYLHISCSTYLTYFSYRAVSLCVACLLVGCVSCWLGMFTMAWGVIEGQAGNFLELCPRRSRWKAGSRAGHSQYAPSFQPLPGSIQLVSPSDSLVQRFAQVSVCVPWVSLPSLAWSCSAGVGGMLFNMYQKCSLMPIFLYKCVFSAFETSVKGCSAWCKGSRLNALPPPPPPTF